MSVEQFGYKQELQRKMSFWGLVGFAMVLMLPIAPVGFLGFMLADSKGMVVLVYIIGAIAMLFTAQSYSTMSNEFPLAGSAYSYATKGVNSFFGFMAGWAILLDYVLVPAQIYLLSTVFVGNLFSIPIWYYILAFIVINTLLNVRGIEFTNKANMAIVGLQFVIIIIFVGLGGYALLTGVNGTSFSMTPLFDSSQFNFNFVMGAVSLAVLSFLGFDGVSTLSEEAKGGSKTVGRAAIFSLILMGIVFIAQSWIGADLIKGIQGAVNPDIAFYQVLEVLGSGWLTLLTTIGAILSWGVACALSYQAAVSRIFYSMARDGKLPAVLAKIHPKYGTPYVGLYVMAIITFVVAFIFQNDVSFLAILVSFGAMVAFVAVNFSVIWYFIVRQKSKQYFKHLIFPAIALIIILLVIVNMDRMAVIFGLAWLATGLIAYYFVKNRSPLDLLEKEAQPKSIEV